MINGLLMLGAVHALHVGRHGRFVRVLRLVLSICLSDMPSTMLERPRNFRGTENATCSVVTFVGPSYFFAIKHPSVIVVYVTEIS